MSAQQEIDRPDNDQPVLSRRELLVAGVAIYADLRPQVVRAASRLPSEGQCEETTSDNHEKNPSGYQVALDVLKDFIAITSRPGIEEAYEKMAKDPAEYIGRADNLGYKDAYFNEGYTFRIFPEELDQDASPETFENYPWSIDIIIREVDGCPVRARVSVRTNAFGDFYSGPSDLLPEEPSDVDFANLERFSDHIFNLPGGIRNLDWKFALRDNLELLSREYNSLNGTCMQTLRSDGVVIFEAPYPISNELGAEENLDGSVPPNLFLG